MTAKELVEKLIEQANLPAGQQWLTLQQLRELAEKEDDNKD